MPVQNCVVAVYPNHETTQRAVHDLRRAGLDMQKLSIVAREHHTDEHVTAYYNIGERMMYWGKFGAFWDALWGSLLGAAFFAIPGIGAVLVAGPLVGWIVATLEGGAVVSGLSALGAGLYTIGIPKDSAVRYEEAIQADKLVLLAYGTAASVARAREILLAGPAEQVSAHQPALEPRATLL